MALSAQLQSAASNLFERARRKGLPVERAAQLYGEQLRPLLVKTLSIYAIGFVRRTHVKVLELERGRVLCRMPIKGNVNHIGTMYAGALFTLAEFPGGPLMLATFGIQRFIPIVTALDMEFLKVAKGDVMVELTLSEAEITRIEAETLATGKSEFIVKGELKSAAGDVVARSHAVYQMRPRRR